MTMGIRKYAVCIHGCHVAHTGHNIWDQCKKGCTLEWTNENLRTKWRDASEQKLIKAHKEKNPHVGSRIHWMKHDSKPKSN
jgi:hypothetical protein